MDPADASFWRVRLDPIEEPTDARSRCPTWTRPSPRRSTSRYDLARARTRPGERDDQRRVPRQSAAARRAARDVVSRQRPGRHAVPAHRRLSRASSPARAIASFGDALGQAFSTDYPTWSLGVTVSYPLGRSYEEASLARARGRAPAGGAADREPAARGGGNGSPGGAAGAQHRRTRRRRARRRDAGRAAARRRAAPLRRRAVDDVPRDAGAARPAAGAGQPAADDARLPVGARELRGRAAGAAAGAGEPVGVRGADVVLLPTPTPRGLFRRRASGQ